MPDEDRLDRNNRNTSESADRLSEKLHGLDKAVAVIGTTLANIDKRLDAVDLTIRTAVASYATKDELKDVDKKVDKIAANIGWGIKFIVGGFLAGVAGLIYKTGLPHG